MPRIKLGSQDKDSIFAQARNMLESYGLQVIESDSDRPWGFFLSINEDQAPQFIEIFYGGVDLTDLVAELPLRPKILGIAPQKRLSLQVHERRNEIWRGFVNPFEVAMGKTEDSLSHRIIYPGQVITLPCGTIHRGIGLGNWGFVAEIWQHTDPNSPSSEDDIIRLADDFGRD